MAVGSSLLARSDRSAAVSANGVPTWNRGLSRSALTSVLTGGSSNRACKRHRCAGQSGVRRQCAGDRFGVWCDFTCPGWRGAGQFFGQAAQEPALASTRLVDVLKAEWSVGQEIEDIPVDGGASGFHEVECER